VHHQPRDEVNVAREPVEFGNDDGRLVLLRKGQRGRQLRPPIQRVRTLAGLDLSELAKDLESLGFREPGQCRALRSSPRPDLPRRSVDTRT
jgi:hypothetical protein